MWWLAFLCDSSPFDMQRAGISEDLLSLLFRLAWFFYLALIFSRLSFAVAFATACLLYSVFSKIVVIIFLV